MLESSKRLTSDTRTLRHLLGSQSEKLAPSAKVLAQLDRCPLC